MPYKKIPVLVKTFEEFAIFVKTKWRATVLAIVFIALLGGIFLSLFYGYKRIELLGTEIDRSIVILEDTYSSAEDLQTDFSNSVEENQAVDNQLTKCVFKHGASAMMVFKFHNSRTDLQGKHDFFYSATNEVSENGMISYLPEAQYIPIVRLGKYITPMIEGNCQIVDVASMGSNEWLKGKLSLSDIETIVSCPIHSEKGNLLGFTELIYTKENPAPIEDKEGFANTLKCFEETTEHISLIIRK